MKNLRRLLENFKPDADFDEAEDFIAEGLFDSVDLQELFAVLEDEYKIRLAGTDLLPQNFSTFEKIRELLESRGVVFED